MTDSPSRDRTTAVGDDVTPDAEPDKEDESDSAIWVKVIRSVPLVAQA
jgi:hypothetical protein